MIRNGGNNIPNQGASSTDCDGEGLMSYDPAPNKWSSCSQKNLKVQYQSIGAANWCLTSSSGKVKKILKGSLDLIPSPSPSVKIQIMVSKKKLLQKF